MVTIRRATDEDRDPIWKIIEPVIRKGDTYAFPPDIAKEEMHAIWTGPGKFTYVAILNDAVVGTFMMRDNQPGQGSHVANAGYIVAVEYAGLGIGRKMGQFSLKEARKLGYRAMQFNLVVSTNQAAIHLWNKLGFEIIGEVPEAFHHKGKGYVSAYIMHRLL